VRAPPVAPIAPFAAPAGRATGAARRGAVGRGTYGDGMSTFRVADPFRPAVERAQRYLAPRRRWPEMDLDLETLTARDAAHLLRTIDAVCADAPAEDLPFEDYALLDELGAALADWLRGLWRASAHSRQAA
jgi:hypothetical protein